ncbi:MAG: tetratricopeptide repeat protein [Myxococcales bacterium]
MTRLLALYVLACSLSAAPGGDSGKADLGSVESRIQADREQLSRPKERDAALEDLRAVADQLEKTVAARPQDARALFLLGRASLYLERMPRARTAFEAASKLSPDDPRTTFYLGYCLSALGERGAALPVLERAVKLDPKNAAAYEELGRLHLDEHRPEQAVAALEKACSASGARPDAFYSLGVALGMLGRHSEATAKFQKAAERDPTFGDAQFNAGLGLHLAGDYAGARRHFEAASKLDPEDAVAHAKLVQVYQSLGLSERRDQERAKVLALHAQGKTRGPDFGVEQFAVGDKWVFASEHYEPKPPKNVHYSFAFLPNSHSTQRLATFTIESGDFEQRAVPDLKPGQRVFTLDQTLPNGDHATFGFFVGPRPYAELRQMVLDADSGKTKPISSTTEHRR